MRKTLTMALFMFLTACGQQEIEEGENVWKDQVQTLDKARSVEQTLQEAEEKRRKQSEEQTR